MKNLKPYDKYKPSGVEWLGDVPEHWETLANRYIFKLKKNLVGKKSSNYDLLSLTLNGIIKRDMENPQGKFPAEFDTYQEVKKGDFVFCLFDVEETPRTVGLSNFDGMITGAYTVMQTNPNFDNGFLYYFYLNLDKDKRLRPLYRGLRNTIPKDSFFSLKTFVPPLEEQTKIANYLDRKTAQIDEAIAQKEQLIALLKERQQILIHQAVTQGLPADQREKAGLDPNVEMKDSGVEWIGDVPKHWEVKRLASFGSFSKGGGIARADLTKEGEPTILYGDIYTKYDIYTEKVINKTSLKVAKKSKALTKGDILLTGSGETIAEIGKCIVYLGNKTAYAGGDVIIFRQNENDNLFLAFVLNSDGVIYEKARFSKGEIVVHTYASKLRNIYIPIPPKSEQIEIAQYLKEQKSLNETFSKKLIEEIAKLKEYKTVLIDAAVTGKVFIN